MFAPLRSPTMTRTTKNIYATKGLVPPPPHSFLIFRILHQTPCVIFRRFAPPPPRRG